MLSDQFSLAALHSPHVQGAKNARLENLGGRVRDQQTDLFDDQCWESEISTERFV